MPEKEIFRIDTCEIERFSDGSFSWSLHLDSQSRTFEALVAGVSKVFIKMLRHTKVDDDIEIKSLCRVVDNSKHITLVLLSNDESIASELALNFRHAMKQVSDVFSLASEIANNGVDPAHIRIVEKDNSSIQVINNEISAHKWVAALANVMRKTTFDKNASFAIVTIKLADDDVVYTIPHGQDRYISDKIIENKTCTVNDVNDKQFATQIIIERTSVYLTFTPDQRDVLITSQKDYRSVDIKWKPNHKIVDGNDQVTNGTLVDVSLTPCLDGL